MDRVNRSFLVPSILLAIPVALLMVSLSSAADPEIQLAVGNGEPTGSVQLVADKKSSAKKRPSLLQVFTGSKSSSKSHTPHNHQAQTPKKSSKGLWTGLLDRANVFGSKSPNEDDEEITPANVPPPIVDWKGIPYHSGNTDSRQSASSSAKPIRDPGASRAPAARVARDSRTSLNAKAASSRRAPDAALQRMPARTLSVPQPPADVPSVESAPRKFATGTSSRRSGGGDTAALGSSETSRKSSATSSKQDDADELVPRVARVEAPKPSSQKPSPQKPETKAASKSASSSAANTAIADQQQPAKTSATDSAVVSGSPKPSTAQMTKSPAVVPRSAPARSYTKPVDPQSELVPIARHPANPNAASTQPAPAAPAFNLGPTSNARSSAQSSRKPYMQARPNSASAPVGSGVVPNGDVTPYRQPATPPYAGHANNGPMITMGQPVSNQPTSRSLSDRAQNRSLAIPAQPMNGSQPTAVADNFDRSTYDSRNEMREATPGASVTTSELPGIRVITQGPGSIMTRQTCQYEIRVENRGSIDAKGVIVRASVPEWAELRGKNASRGEIDSQVEGSTERLIWNIDHIPAGHAERMLIRLTAARSGTYDIDVDWTLLPQKNVARVQVREPRLELTIDGPDEVVYGQSQTYTVRVLNPGDGTAPNVVFTLSPNSATPQTQRIGDIPPGKEAQFDVELTAQDLGDLKIHGLAAGDLELRAESSKSIRVATAKLEAVLSGPELRYQNTQGIYTLELNNAGTASCEKIIASLRIPAGVEYLGGIDQAAVQGDVLKWEISTLTPGASREYEFRCNMISTGEQMLAFDCSGTAAGNANVSIETAVESIADLVLSVSDPAAPAPVGSEVTYEIIIRNRGSKEATGVRVVTQFSHGIEPQRVEGQSGKISTGQVMFDAVPRIGAGQEVRLRVIAKAETAGHHRFRTEVSAGETLLVAEEATHYMSSKSDRVSRRSSSSGSR
jgi:uncharacterized repeat protein (TIGR01451 family)